MTRIERFQSFQSHPMHGRDIRRLSKLELKIVEEFLEALSESTDDEFMLAANRFQLDMPKSKNYSIMWSLLIQTVDTVGNIRRRKAAQEAK